MRTVISIAALICAAMTAAADPLTSLDGTAWDFPDAGGAFIQFSGDAVSGHSGCNRFGGRYTFSGGTLSIGPLAATRMACPEDKMKTEREVFAILDAAKSAVADAASLTLKDGTGKVLATLQPRGRD